MRAVKVKALRKFARKNTEGKPVRGLVCIKTNARTALNDPNTTRGVYRLYKKMPSYVIGLIRSQANAQN